MLTTFFTTAMILAHIVHIEANSNKSHVNELDRTRYNGAWRYNLWESKPDTTLETHFNSLNLRSEGPVPAADEVPGSVQGLDQADTGTRNPSEEPGLLASDLSNVRLGTAKASICSLTSRSSSSSEEPVQEMDTRSM